VDLDLTEIVGTPKFAGELIFSAGSWNGSGDCWDIYYDVMQAIKKLPCDDNASHMLLTAEDVGNINHMNAERIPWWELILPLFVTLPVVDGVDLRPCIKNHIFRKSCKLPQGIALLVSDRNNVVIIHTIRTGGSSQ
jgi:hypothetical protein